MEKKPFMRRLAKWHIWLGWLVGFPILMWLVTGLFMVARPIEEVRGSHLRLKQDSQPLILPGSTMANGDFPIREMRAIMQDGRPVAILTAMDGSVRRVDMASGAEIAPANAARTRQIVTNRIKGGDQVKSIQLFLADQVPFDFRRSIPVWQVVLDDGTHIYVGRDTGEIEAVRTRWWRWFDFMWGLHIMDLQSREDTSHPVLILFAFLSAIGAMLGCILMFRRRRKQAGPL